MYAEQPVIVIVDDNIANLRLAKNALEGTYEIFTLPSAEKMFDLLKRNKPALILLDIEMPIMDGYAAIKILKQDTETRDIPVIFLTGKEDEESELVGLSLGAVDYISKPFMPRLLCQRVDLHLTMEAQKHKLEDQTRILEEKRLELQNFNNNLQNMVNEKTGKVLELQNAILKTVANLVESR
ncbi:MAG: response regulator, partial [Desulfovibrio sp.]|nr:response regulator [Desulfovibrio sp.]